MTTAIDRQPNQEAGSVFRRVARPAHRGQVLIIVALGMVVLVAMVGVVIDGGYAWGKQRDTQNGADAIAKAGAVKLAENVAGKDPANTDADVLAAMTDTAASNAVGMPDAWYTDFDGNLITPAGAPAADPATAAPVGGGSIPPGAAGVRAVADQDFETFLARIVGIDQFSASADATARAGYVTSTCPSSAGCGIMPVTVPVTVVGCDGSNNPAPVTDGDGDKLLWTAPSDPLTIPLCKNGPGNVGWIDWTPTAGGTDELEQAILNPSNPELRWPGWYYITSTGNVNSKKIEDALNTNQGEVVLIPQFDLTCDTKPSGPGVEDCPPANVGGNGSNQWYHLAGMSSFRLCTDDGSMPDCVSAGLNQGAYITGSNKVPCDTGNGGTSCLAGKFVVIVYEGEVAAAPGVNSASSVVGIQLIR